MGVKLYNCMPNRLKILTSVNIFKYEVNGYSLKTPFILYMTFIIGKSLSDLVLFYEEE
jgi:hypothetical protein